MFQKLKKIWKNCYKFRDFPQAKIKEMALPNSWLYLGIFTESVGDWREFKVEEGVLLFISKVSFRAKVEALVDSLFSPFSCPFELERYFCKEREEEEEVEVFFIVFVEEFIEGERGKLFICSLENFDLKK